MGNENFNWLKTTGNLDTSGQDMLEAFEAIEAHLSTYKYDEWKGNIKNAQANITYFKKLLEAKKISLDDVPSLDYNEGKSNEEENKLKKMVRECLFKNRQAQEGIKNQLFNQFILKEGHYTKKATQIRSNKVITNFLKPFYLLKIKEEEQMVAEYQNKLTSKANEELIDHIREELLFYKECLAKTKTNSYRFKAFIVCGYILFAQAKQRIRDMPLDKALDEEKELFIQLMNLAPDNPRFFNWLEQREYRRNIKLNDRWEDEKEIFSQFFKQTIPDYNDWLIKYMLTKGE